MTGTLTRLVVPKPKHGKQRTVTSKLRSAKTSVKSGRKVSVTLKLPAAAVTALAKKAKESAAFRLAVTNANGTAHATARIRALKGTR